ncbi:MAG: leucine--tRNA ligase [Candidatus Aenigmarchaeota archaeon]|nr:leucine--tRNA ligase [Candidatus Aenigmarchaeota archaeon]
MKLNLKAIAKRWQKVWAERKLFEADPLDKPKFFITVPYPYVNGYMHIGHTYTDMRPEAFARYKRMRGFNVLFPFAFHATGTPIESAAKLVAEKDEKQLSIYKDMGFKDEEIARFCDPKNIIKTFVKAARKDINTFGLSVDWRRSFFTTELNPRYSKFIQWQFRKLHKAGYLTKGSHPVVWCHKDNMAVGDHARSEGEGEVPEELTIIKFKADDVIFPCTTTRPETVFGVTNLWINPNLTYVKALVDGETWIVAEEAVPKLEAQKHKVQIVEKHKGEEILRKHVHNPLTNTAIPVFPAVFVTAHTGTGVVMSVPAHAPADFAALEDYKKQDSAARNIVPISLIKVEGFGEIPAAEACKKYNIKDQNDARLEEATREVYSKEFHTGVLLPITGKYQGLSVQNVKQKIISDLVDAKHAVKFYELLNPVVCRCRTRCHVKIVDNQWFLAYGNLQWKEKTHKALANCKLYPEKVRTQFMHVIDWLKDWACARQLGLGTKLPLDKEWVIESLSDSTIYNAYYTIAHHLKNIPVSQLNEAFFDYILLGQGTIDKIKADHNLVEQMKQEFNYWYPVDFRNSGKDLVQNHLSFYLFNHTAIFAEKHWPVGIGVNGYVTLQKMKMSKSKGNVRFMRDLIKLWGPDVVRMSILTNAEELDDADWDDDVAASNSQKLIQWYTFAVDNYGEGDSTKTDIDAWFVSKINACTRDMTCSMDKTLFRTALQRGYFDLQRYFKWYARRRGNILNAEIVKQFIETQTKMLVPFVPHICEEIWMKLQKQMLASTENWPVFDEAAIKPELDAIEDGIAGIVDDISTVVSLSKIEKPVKINIIVAADWKSKLFTLVKDKIKTTRNAGELIKIAMQDVSLKEHGAETAAIIQRIAKDHGKLPATVLHQEVEYQFLKDSTAFLKANFGCEIEVVKEQESKEMKAKQALPGKPAVVVS